MNERSPATLTSSERTLREMLWRIHASNADGHFAYGDDGEMQCSSREDGYCDFLRHDAEKIREHIERRGFRILAQIMAMEANGPQAQPPASPEPEASKQAGHIFIPHGDPGDLTIVNLCAMCGLPWSQHGGRDGR